MDSKFIFGLVSVLLGATVMYFLYSCSGIRSSSEEIIAHPPFNIKKRNSFGSRFDINTNSRKDDSRSTYRIYFRDKEIMLPGKLNENTGVSGLWKAYILKDAPQPALIVASQSVYLITEENGEVKITTVSEGSSDFASFQWLDSNQGQPGQRAKVYSSNDRDKSCEFSGGQFLLVNRKVVLDVHTLSLFPFQIDRQQTNDFDSDYVIGFSPDKSKIVFMARKYFREYSYALVTCDFRTSESSVIPFDRNKRQLHEAFEWNPDWLNRYFSWKSNEAGQAELVKREFDVWPNWEGHFGRNGNYSLSPVKLEMMDIFAEFVKDHLQLTEADVQRVQFGDEHEYRFNVGKNKVELNFLSEDTVYFSDQISDKDEEGCKNIFKTVGEAFNKKLRSGEHQDLFTSYHPGKH